MCKFKVGDLVVRKENADIKAFIRVHGSKFGTVICVGEGGWFGLNGEEGDALKSGWNDDYFDLVESDIGL